MRKQLAVIGTAVLAVALTLGGCSGDNKKPAQAAGCGFPPGVACRPARERVDTATPTFSNPTKVTNPLFPMAALAQVIQLGTEEGKASRVEITLLPTTRVIDWKGMRVEALQSQFLALLGGRIVEIAVDYFAQDDSGAVWYLGESVSNYENGTVTDHEGSSLAGKDGDAGMIMPAHPKVGDVYRPENIPGLVFEEDRVEAVGVTATGPRGPVNGAIRVREHLADDTNELKVFAPGYGEFDIRANDEHGQVAVAIPIDAVATPVPAELDAISTAATAAGTAAEQGDWTTATSQAATARAAWTRTDQVGVPPLVVQEVERALTALTRQVQAHAEPRARQAALDVRHAVLDVRLPHGPLAEIDRGRLGVWTDQAVLDADQGRFEDVHGDAVVLGAIATRSAPGLGATADAVGAAAKELETAAAGEKAGVDAAIAKLTTAVAPPP